MHAASPSLRKLPRNSDQEFSIKFKTLFRLGVARPCTVQSQHCSMPRDRQHSIWVTITSRLRSRIFIHHCSGPVLDSFSVKRKMVHDRIPPRLCKFCAALTSPQVVELQLVLPNKYYWHTSKGQMFTPLPAVTYVSHARTFFCCLCIPLSSGKQITRKFPKFNG